MISPPAFHLGGSDLNRLRQHVQQVSAQVRLPFRSKVWRGQTGNWLGAGIGSSIDFQDHRQYLPGDDPRYIDWQAYARSGHYTMKLYREEVSPKVDVLLDLSESMAITPAKVQRVIELFYFVVESSLQAGASLRCWLGQGDETESREIDQVVNHAWLPEAGAANASKGSRKDSSERPEENQTLDISRVAWRSGSMRVVISDLLFPGEPEAMLKVLSAGKGRGVLLAPYDESEAMPEWAGNIQFVDCETQFERNQRVEPDILERYLQTYRRHFALWSEQARRHGLVLARISAEGELLDGLRGEPLTEGAVELWA